MELLEKLFVQQPYSLLQLEKERYFRDALRELILFHNSHCSEYKKFLTALNYDTESKHEIVDMPFLPVRLFKEYELRSVDNSLIVKTMTSSGTSGEVSKIFLDKVTALNQTKVLTKILSATIGSYRLPMIILDSESVIKDRTNFSARGAGILGFSMFGKERLFALDEEMNLDIDKITAFCEKHKGSPILIFGFTYIVWVHFYKELARAKKKVDLSRGILIHGGGWKKMADQSVDNERFKDALKKVAGIQRVYNYYGMVEQTGSIFLECDEGHLHCPIYSDILIRKKDFSIADMNETGMIELVSLLPSSYPGHIILSEDIGEILGVDDCPCGRLGKYFKVHGRIAEAEIRGCSDTHE